MTIGATLLEVFYVFWLLAVLALLLWMAVSSARRTQRIEASLLRANEQSARAAHEAAAAATLLAHVLTTQPSTTTTTTTTVADAPPHTAPDALPAPADTPSEPSEPPNEMTAPHTTN